MTDFMQNIYVILWGVLALLTFAVGIKQKAPYDFIIFYTILSPSISPIFISILFYIIIYFFIIFY